MRTLHLSLITSNQNQKEKADRVSTLVSSLLPDLVNSSVTKYEKIDNSFKLTFQFKLDEENLVENMIHLTDKICSPWLVTYHDNEGIMDMVFNESELTRYGRVEFNVIGWGNLTVE